MDGDLRTFEAIVDRRWTCRQFRPDPVPDTVLGEVLRISQRAPSWCNTQPWHLHITRGSATQRFRDGLREHVASGAADRPDVPFPVRYAGVYRERRKECAAQLYESVGVTREDREGAFLQGLRNFDLFDAPHVAILTTEADLGAYGILDCGLYLHAFLLAAAAAGIATASQAAIAGYSLFVRDHLALPANRWVVAGISFGYPVADDPVNQFRTRRGSVDDATTHCR